RDRDRRARLRGRRREHRGGVHRRAAVRALRRPPAFALARETAAGSSTFPLHTNEGRRDMYGLTRGTMTLLGAAGAGVLLWLASQVNEQSLGGYWGFIGLTA